MLIEKEPKVAKKFVCIFCDYETCKKNNYVKHLLTQKHINRENAKNTNKKEQKVATFDCLCGRKYKYQSSLCYHKRRCNYKEETDIIPEESLTDELDNLDNKTMFMMIINENKELRKTVSEQQKQIGELIPKVGNNNHTNNNIKNRFNINVFLNEQCKDALSIDEFINKIEVSMKNLLTTKDKGLAEGLTNIIIENMNKLSIYERPVHCTDKKRETLYIKNDEWVKDINNDQLKEALKKISNKQFRKIKQWIDDNPNYTEDDKLQDEYIKLVTKCTTSLNENERKLIKNVCDNVYLEK